FFNLIFSPMKINWLHLLVVLIAMQSSMAVADLHQAHQAEQEHIGFNHSDDLASHSNQVNSNLLDTQPDFAVQPDITPSYDCHHCSHCHSSACHYSLKEETSSFLFRYNNDEIFENFSFYSTRIISPNLRPPIV
ncbi:MAG: hypothetical protein L3J83_11670, partial [Proteobacteria bacterium]|nr:hypothetical protein [Pseudomonadota bacterium]